mmetsp:Transcript_24377/g.23980  ORF Transcript_24377/g.23980 Transcript_24377/m.23980 type:complete len:101 (+) Transcript_24377:513-815(+)
MKSKKFAHEKDSIYSTGHWKLMALEMVLAFICPYPALYGKYYTEQANIFEESFVADNYPDVEVPVHYNVNDLLLCVMMLTRIHFFMRAIINVSEHKQPRA